MLDYPKLEEYKKGGRVVKKKNMKQKQKQSQKQIVNVYTHAPKRTYRRPVKKVEPIQQRTITMAPIRAELPSYIYSKPLSTLPILNQPTVSSVIPPLNPSPPNLSDKIDDLNNDMILHDIVRQHEELNQKRMKKEKKKKEQKENIPEIYDLSSLDRLPNYEENLNFLPNLEEKKEREVKEQPLEEPEEEKKSDIFEIPTKGNLNELINKLGSSGIKKTVNEGSNPYKSSYKNYYAFSLVNNWGYNVDEVVKYSQKELADLLKKELQKNKLKG